MAGLRIACENKTINNIIISPIKYCMRFDPLVMTQWKDARIANLYQRFLTLEKAREVEIAKERKRELAASAQSAVAAALENNTHLPSLYVAVAEIFATGLKREVAHVVGVDFVLFDDCGKSLPSDEKLKNSAGGLFAKWAPTPSQKHDKATGLVNVIIERIFATWEPELTHKFFGGRI